MTVTETPALAGVNVDLLRRTLAHIEAHPEEWEQTTWRCDTGMCFAGTAATLAGGTWATSNRDGVLAHLLVAEPDDYKSPVVTVISAKYYRTDKFTGNVVRASERAQRLLGLTRTQCLVLFSGYNTLDGVRLIVADLCAQAVQS